MPTVSSVSRFSNIKSRQNNLFPVLHYVSHYLCIHQTEAICNALFGSRPPRPKLWPLTKLNSPWPVAMAYQLAEILQLCNLQKMATGQRKWPSWLQVTNIQRLKGQRTADHQIKTTNICFWLYEASQAFQLPIHPRHNYRYPARIRLTQKVWFCKQF